MKQERKCTGAFPRRVKTFHFTETLTPAPFLPGGTETINHRDGINALYWVIA